MDKAKSTRILWVDDQIDGLSSFVSALGDAGFQVTTATSTEPALQLARYHDYDVILVDLSMPPPDGIELLRRIHPMRPKASLAALSSYLYLGQYRNQLRALGFPVELVDKDIPNTEAADFYERFILPIVRLAKEGVKNTIEFQEKLLAQESGEDPFDIPLAEFMKKPILEKDQLVDKARRIAATTIEKEFAAGKTWVLLCGSKDYIRTSVSSLDEIPSEEKIMEFARVQQRPPFQFFKSIGVDDQWSNCSDAGALKNYPTVTLEFDDEQIAVHFDTGAPVTFFSYEELLRLRKITPTGTFGIAARGARTYRAIPLNIEVILRCQQTGRSKTVHLTGQVVRDWFDSPYARLCDVDCAHLKNQQQHKGRRPCPERIGLVGRNLLVDNAISLILDGVQHSTRLQ